MTRINIFLRWPKPTEPGQLFLLVLISLLTAASWFLTIHQARTMDMPMGVAISGAGDPAASSGNTGSMANMPGMAMSTSASDPVNQMAASGMSGMGWAWHGFLAFLFAWSVMMAAMMFPAAAPMVLFFDKIVSQRHGQGRAFVPTWIFAAGYLLVWTGIGSATWVLIRLASDVATRLGDSSRSTWTPLVLGTVLVAAGLYQFTPLKRACLRQCQSPLNFVMTQWRDGRSGALHMGVIHGMYCLGCCWMLFAVLVAAGVMSLAWMLVLTLVVFAEKVLLLGARAAQISGAALIVLGIGIVVRGAGMPWSV